MKIIADENIDRSIVLALRESGYDVLAIVESFPGISDVQVAELVSQHKALLLTEDKEFADVLVWKKQYKFGVVLIRLSDVSSIEKGRITAHTVAQHEFEMTNAVTAITSRSIRIRKFH